MTENEKSAKKSTGKNVEKKKEQINLKKELGGILLDLQKEKGTKITVDNAMELLSARLQSSYKTKDLLVQLSKILNKEKLTFNDIANVEIDGYKTLQAQFTNEYYKKLDDTNKRGTLSAHTKHMTEILSPIDGSSMGFGKFLKNSGFPQYNKEIGRWIVNGQEYKVLPSWNKNYFVELRNQVDRYLDYLESRGDKKAFNYAVKALGSKKLKLGTIVQHFKDIGLYDATTMTANTIIGGVGSRVVGAKKYSKALKRMVDPKNLVEGLTNMTIATETAEFMNKFTKEKTTLTDYFTNRGGDLNQYLLNKYPIVSFKKTLKKSGLESNYEKFEYKYYHRCLEQAKNAGDTTSAILAEGMLRLTTGKENLSDSRIKKLRKAVMKQLGEQRRALAKESGIYDHLRRAVRNHNPVPTNEMIEKYISSHQQFWKDFYDLDKTEHTLVDSKGVPQTFIIEKNLVFSPGTKKSATDIADLFHLELAYKPQLGENGNYNMMAAMALDDLWSLKGDIVMYPESLDQKLSLQKSQKYRIHGPKGEVVEGYVQVNVSGEAEGDYLQKFSEPHKYTIRLLDKLSDSTDIEESGGTFPFGKEGKESISSLTQGWTFEPIDEQGNTVDPTFKVKLPLGSNHNYEDAFPAHLSRLEKISLMMVAEQAESEKIPLKKNILEEFDINGFDVFEKEEEQERLSESELKLRKRYLKTRVVTEIPQDLKDKTPSDDIHAWIEDGEIFLYNNHFKKSIAEGGLGIDLLDPNNGLVDKEGYIVDLVHLNEWVNESIGDIEEYTRRKTILLEIRKITVHEKAHRIFHYYGVEDGEVSDLTTDKATIEKKGSIVVYPYDNPKKKLLLSNETLAEIAEGRLFKNESEEVLKNIPVAFRYITVDDGSGILQDAVVIKGDDGKDYTVLISHIEEVIRQKDVGLRNFAFKDILDLDKDLIEDLIQGEHLDVFKGLLEARSERELESGITRAAVDANAGTHVYIYSDDGNPGGSGVNALLAGAPNAINIPFWGTQAQIDAAINDIQTAYAGGAMPVLLTNADGTSALSNYGTANPAAQHLVDQAHSDLQRLDPNLGHTPTPAPAPPTPAPTPGNPPETPDDTRERYRRQNEERLESERAHFDKAYNELEGDASLNNGPEIGDILMVRDGTSPRPGGASDWIKLRISDVTQDNIQLTFEGHTEKNASSFIGDTFVLPRTEEGIKRLKNYAKQKVFKYKPQSSQSAFLSYKGRAGLDGGWDDVKMDGTKDYKEGGEGRTKNGKVTHVAILPSQIAPYDLKRTIYEVERLDGGVKIKTKRDTEVDKKGKPVAQEEIIQTMDYSMFTHFCRDKKLQPYTQAEIDRSAKYDRLDAKAPNDPQPSWRDKLMSITGIISMIKKFPETFKVKQEQEAKLQGAMLFNKVLQGLPDGLDGGLLYLSDIKADALSEQDATIMQIIEDYKGRLTRTDIGEGSHGALGAKIIKTQIFDKTMRTKSDRLKAAGYFLYAIENGGNPYQRALQENEGSGIWVQKILGDTYQQDFLKEQKQLIDLWETGGKSDDTLQDRIAKLELHYIQTRTLDHPFFGSRFARAIEEKMDKWGKIDAVDGVKDAISAKGNFYEIYNGFKGGGISNMLPHVFMGSLLAMEANIEDPEHYEIFYQSIVSALISGYTKSFSKAYMDKFKGMCRRVGIPIGMFISDPYGSKKATDVIDYIAKKSNIKPTLTGAIKSALGDTRDPAKQNVMNYNKGKKAIAITNVIENWWGENGRTIMNSFNYKEKYLVEGLSDQSIEGTKYESAIENYFGDSVVFNSYKDYSDVRNSDMKDGDNPLYDGIFNLAPGSFQSYMMNFSGRGFNTDQSYEMWKQFHDGVSSFKSIVDQSKTSSRGTDEQKSEQLRPMVKFLLKKWSVYFGKKIGKPGINLMKKFFLGNPGANPVSGTEGVKQLIGTTVYQNSKYRFNEDTEILEPITNNYNNQSSSAPPIVKETLNSYIDLIGDGLEGLTDADKIDLVNNYLNE